VKYPYAHILSEKCDLSVYCAGNSFKYGIGRNQTKPAAKGIIFLCVNYTMHFTAISFE